MSIPKGTVVRIVKSALEEEEKGEMKIMKECREKIVKCAECFVRQISIRAQKIADDSKKKSMSKENVLEILKEMGFKHYTDEIDLALEEEKVSSDAKRSRNKRKRDKFKKLVSEDMIRKQDELFKNARKKHAKSMVRTNLRKNKAQSKDNFLFESETIETPTSSFSFGKNVKGKK